MFTIWVILCQCGIFKLCKKKKNAYPFDAMFFSIMFFPHCSFFLRNDLHYKPVPHLSMFFFFRLHYKPTSRCPGNEPASPTKKLFSGQNKTRPRERRKSSLFFATESIFRASDWYSPGRLKKKKARGARWEGERLLLALIGIPSRSLRWWERIIPVAPFSIVTIFRRDLVLIKSPSLAPSLRNMSVTILVIHVCSQLFELFNRVDHGKWKVLGLAWTFQSFNTCTGCYEMFSDSVNRPK